MFQQRLENLEILENRNGHGKVMEMEGEKRQKVMEFCDSSWSFTIQFYQICAFTFYMKFNSSLNSLHFLTFSAKCPQCKILADR